MTDVGVSLIKKGGHGGLRLVNGNGGNTVDNNCMVVIKL